MKVKWVRKQLASFAYCHCCYVTVNGKRRQVEKHFTKNGRGKFSHYSFVVYRDASVGRFQSSSWDKTMKALKEDSQ